MIHQLMTVQCSPVDYFRQFLNADLFQYIMDQSNLYAVLSGSSFRTTVAELEQYVGILMKMGMVPMPSYRSYWSTELRLPAVADIMSRDRFFDLNRFLHFSDNSTAVTNREDSNYDRFYKVRPLLTYLRNACLCD